MRLQTIGPPDALHRVQRQPDRFGHRPAGPMGRLAGRFAAGQRQHLVDGLQRHRLFARRPGLVAQQTFHARLGVATLPAPHRGPAHPGADGDLLHQQPFRREQHDAGALHMLQKPVAITHNRFQAGAILVADDDTKLLGHARMVSYPSL